MGMFKITIIVIVACIVIALIFQYLIIIKKLKPNKLSKLFYEDNESFIISWEKTREKGMLKHTLKNTIIAIVLMGIIGMFLILNNRSMYGYDQSQTLFVSLSVGVILGLINSLTGWVIRQNRYRELKRKVDSDNMNNTNKKL